jgi:hypothetical protein
MRRWVLGTGFTGLGRIYRIVREIGVEGNGVKGFRVF